MNEDLNDIFKDIPEIINSQYEMEEPNLPIEIYEGEFTLIQKENSVKVTGRIFFDWFPHQNVKFEGIINETEHTPFVSFDASEKLDLLINDIDFGIALLSNITRGQNVEVSGIIQGESVLGDKSIPVSKINFTIPNLIDLWGDTVKVLKENGVVQTCKNRVLFENDDFIITIDKSSKFKTLSTELSKKGGYVVLYVGELTKKTGSIEHDQLQELIYSFSIFLSFLNGRRCAPLFLQGTHANEVIWTDFTAYNTDQFKYVTSWCPKFSIDGMSELWQQFSIIWKNQNDKNFLDFLIHWYVEANGNSGYMEGSIIMAQIALELVYNWLIIEKKRLLIGKDGENISAANKIRLLLGQINLETVTPTAFENLKKFVDDNNELVDGVDAFVQIRNALIHSQEEKRKKLTNISSKIKYEAQQLSLQYIEYSLLSILGYKGKYYNRCSGKYYAGEGEEYIQYK
ncbi:hypothetical protein [Draconibacterium sediminis]|uniref:hypothetical protein n=1 Tax=Draconibacterium sediminis TaxID=1544798 RepID=UPI0026E976F3|nr:hypothetical protein [Draconibacterium sediminis]